MVNTGYYLPPSAVPSMAFTLFELALLNTALASASFKAATVVLAAVPGFTRTSGVAEAFVTPAVITKADKINNRFMNFLKL